MDSAPTLAEFVKHAERFGVEQVYETAEEAGLPPVELGYLARHLRRIDKRWRLTSEQRNRLILCLADARVSDKEIRDMAGISQDTVSRVRRESETSDPGPASPATTRREVRKLTWDREYPYQTISAYFPATDRRSWPPLIDDLGLLEDAA